MGLIGETIWLIRNLSYEILGDYNLEIENFAAVFFDSNRPPSNSKFSEWRIYSDIESDFLFLVSYGASWFNTMYQKLSSGYTKAFIQ